MLSKIRKINPRELRVFNNKDYRFFVCDTIEGLQILSGWEYKTDALDSMKEEKETYSFYCKNEELKIYTRRHLNNLLNK